MNQAFPRKFFNQLGLVSLLLRCLSFDVTREPPYTEHYVRWCGRREGASPPPPRSMFNDQRRRPSVENVFINAANASSSSSLTPGLPARLGSLCGRDYRIYDQGTVTWIVSTTSGVLSAGSYIPIKSWTRPVCVFFRSATKG